MVNILTDFQPAINKVLDFLHTPFGSIILTGLLLLLAISINKIMHLRLRARNQENFEDSKLRAKLVSRHNMVWAIVILVIVALWSSKVTSFLISIAAIGGALFIASKELILCWWGALLISLNKNLKIGSIVEIGKHTGQLVNTGFFTFELAEIGPSRKQTGRLLQLPNYLLFLEPIKNLSTYGHYGVHLIDFHLGHEVDVYKAEELVLQLAHEVGQHWFDKAHNHFLNIEKSRLMELPKAQPEVFWSSIDEKCLCMTLRFGCPMTRRGQFEKQIVMKFWQNYQNMLCSTSQEAERSR